MLVIAQQTIPRGGTLTVDAIGEGDAISFRIHTAGPNARIPQNIIERLNETGSAIDAHAVQPYYTRLLAASCSLRITMETAVDDVVMSALPVA